MKSKFECDTASSFANGIETSRSNLQANISPRPSGLAVISSTTHTSLESESSTSAVVAVVTATSTSSIGNRDLTTGSATRSRMADTAYTVSASANSTSSSALVYPKKASFTYISSLHTDCSSLKSPYTPPAVAGSGQFDIACQTDFDLPHFLELTTKSFIECITKCARYNLSQMVELEGKCAVASFMASGYEGITCWLKSADSPIRGRKTEKVSSAVARAEQAQ